MAKTRRDASGDSQRSYIQFLWYRRALEDFPPEASDSVWKLPAQRMRKLRQAGIWEASPAERTALGLDDEYSLEAVIEKIARADDWPRRLSAVLKKLTDSDARRAVERLVKLGCVPDHVAWCVSALGLEATTQESRRVRAERMKHRPMLRDLAAGFEAAADACADYLVRVERLGYVNRAIGLMEPAELRDRARNFRELAAGLDGRQRVSVTRAD